MGFLRRVLGGGRKVQPPRHHGEPAPSGILAGLFTAPDSEVAEWSLRLPTPERWAAFEFKWLDTVKLGTLEAILTGRTYDAIDQDQLHNLVREGGPEGPWVVRVRCELVDALAGLDADKAAPVAHAWADTDEWKGRPSESADPGLVAGLTVLLPEMATFALSSLQAGTPVYLLMSL